MFTATAAHYTNLKNFTGRKELGRSKEYKTEQAAKQFGVKALVKERDGNNFVVIMGPKGHLSHLTV